MYEEEDGEQGTQGQSGGFMQRAKSIVLLLVILSLTCAVLYLVSERNAARFFLVSEDGSLIVKQGIFFPVGEKPYVPDDARLAQIYAPLPLPPEGFTGAKQEFSDRGALDKALFDQLVTWSKERIGAKDRSRLERGIAYLRRAEVLPASTEGQRSALASLEGQVAFFEAEQLLTEASDRIDDAVSRLERARTTGVIGQGDADGLMQEVREQGLSILQLIDKVQGAAERSHPDTDALEEALGDSPRLPVEALPPTEPVGAPELVGEAPPPLPTPDSKGGSLPPSPRHAASKEPEAAPPSPPASAGLKAPPVRRHPAASGAAKSAGSVVVGAKETPPAVAPQAGSGGTAPAPQNPDPATLR